MRTMTRLKIQGLECRIQELEDILCPEGHDWYMASERTIFSDDDILYEKTYVCRRCRKRFTTTEFTSGPSLSPR